MESERHVAWKRPNQPPPTSTGSTTFPATRPILGPTIIPMVTAPETGGGSVYPAEAVHFRHIDSSSGSSAAAGPFYSGRARLAEPEYVNDPEMDLREIREVREQGAGPETSGRTQNNGTQEVQDETREETPKTTQKKRINKCPIILGTLLGLAIVGLIGIFIAWAVTSDGFRNLGGLSDVCSTSECIKISSSLTTSIDNTVDICDNFYRHMCGQFHYEHPSVPGVIYNYESRLYEEMENQLQEILSKPSNTSSSFSYQFSRSLYSQCIDFPLRESVNTEPLITVLHNLPCGPLLPKCSGFNEDRYSWERSAGLIDIYAGDFNLVRFERAANIQNPAAIILSFDAPDLTEFLRIPKTTVEYLQTTTTSAFQALLSVQLKNWLMNETVVDLLGVEWSDGVSKDMDEVVEFVVELDELTSNSRQNNAVGQIMTLEEFAAVLQPIDLKAVFDASLSASLTWSWADTVAVDNVYYYQNLNQLLRRFSKKAVANYLTLVTAWNLRQYLHLKNEQEDWRKCLKQMSVLDPLANVYASNNWINFNSLTSFFSDLRAYFISENLQFTPPTLDTLRRAELKLGVPTRILDEAELARMFSAVRILEDSYEQNKVVNMIPWQSSGNSDYFASFLAAIKYQRSFELSKVGTFVQPGDSVNWKSLEPEIVYNALGNEIVIPISFFQNPPLAVPLSPAPISSVLATTGFLFYSFLYTTASSLQQNDMQLPCMAEVYSQFVLQNLSIRQDQFVKLAVLGLNSLELVYQKDREWKRENSVKREQVLPGFANFTDQQLILLQFGALMCSSEGELQGSAYEGMVNTVASLSSHFDSFKCPSNSRMRPQTTCQLDRLPTFSSTVTIPPESTFSTISPEPIFTTIPSDAPFD